MNMIGKVDVDKLNAIKAELFEKGDDPLMSDAYQMIEALESTIVIMFQNHQDYCEKTANYIKQLNEKIIEQSWERNPDRSGGQFSQDEIDRSRNGGW